MSRDRDRILEQALKHELRAAGTPAAGGCLDAETLGAWTDGALSPTALAAAEAHVSNCTRCQAMVAVMRRDQGRRSRLPLKYKEFSFWKWWLAPIAAGVTAVTLWMVVPDQQQVAVTPPQSPVADKNAAQPPAAAAESVAPQAQPFGANRDQAGRADQLAAAATEARQRAIVESELKNEKARAEATERGALADAAAPPCARRARRTAGTCCRRGGACASRHFKRARETSRLCRPAKTSPIKPRRLPWCPGMSGAPGWSCSQPTAARRSRK